VKTDSLLYRIFKTAPSIFFELIGQPNLQGYEFQSVEVKQTAHRIDGVFLPPENTPDNPIFFAEFQFQDDPLLYHRLFAEIFIYLEQNPHFADWQAVVIFPRLRLEPTETRYYRALLDCPQVQRFYLNELSDPETLPPSLGLLQLIVTPPQNAIDTAKQLIVQTENNPDLPPALILELIITTMVYKFPQLSREEIIQMLEIASEAQQTRFYQEAKEEGRQEGRQEGEKQLILRLLNRRFDSISAETRSRIETLNSQQLEALAEALFDFTSIEDLQQWLQDL
jgi:predicted transposase/invertase (TIGR01784 family)